MSKRYIDADNMKMVLICTEKELTIEDIVTYIDNNICNDVIPLDRVEQILSEIDLQLEDVGAYDIKVAKVQRYIRDKIKAIKEQNR